MNRKYVRRRIKEEAQVLLVGNWLKVLLIALISMMLPRILILSLPLRIPAIEEIAKAGNNVAELYGLFFRDSITLKHIASFAVTAILYLFLAAPFSIGVCRFFLKVAAGEKPKLSVVFSPYTSLKTVFSSIWLWFLLMFVCAFWGVVFVLVVLLFFIIALFLESVVLTFLSTILSIVLPVFGFLWTSRYLFVSYIFAEDESKGAFGSLRECIELMRGRAKECMILRGSYFLWDLLSARVFPLQFIYFGLWSTVYAKYLPYLRGEASFSEESAPPEV